MDVTIRIQRGRPRLAFRFLPPPRPLDAVTRIPIFGVLALIVREC